MKIARILSYYDYNDVSWGSRAPSTQLKLLTINIFGKKKIVSESFYNGGYCDGELLCLYKKGYNSEVMFIDNAVKLSILTKSQIKKMNKLFPELDDYEGEE